MVRIGQSIFHTFLHRFTQSLFTNKCTLLNYRHLCWLLERVDCVADKPKLEWNILGLRNFNIFWGNNGPLLTLSVSLIKPAGYFNCYWKPWYMMVEGVSSKVRGPATGCDRGHLSFWKYISFTVSVATECFHSRGQHLCKFIGTKESVCIIKEFNSHRTRFGHQHGRRFIVLGHQYGRRDVMWKHSIVRV